MARRIGFILVALALLGVRTLAALEGEDKPVGDPATGAAATPEPTATPAADTGEARRERPRRWLPEDPEERRKALEHMPPEQRERLRRNFERWKNLPDDKKRELRERHDQRAERIRREIDKTLEELGLTLDDAQKREFSRRYFAGRKRIEETLRMEMDRKREKLVEKLRQRLEREFGEKTPTDTAPETSEKSGSETAEPPR